MKKITIIFLMFLLVTFSFAHKSNVPHYVKMEDPAGLVNPDGFFQYMIVKGDCLWFIADEFYNDPFKWKKIHKANPYIVDPNWIYPNNWLVIPSVFADENGKPIYSVDGIKPVSPKKIKGVAIDMDGDSIIDGVDLDGDGIIDAQAGIDLDRDGIIDGYDMDGDGVIDVKSTAAIAAAYGVDLDGDGIIDGVDIDGDGLIDEHAGKDIDGDGIIDGYDVDGDNNIDVKVGAAAKAAIATTATAISTTTEKAESDKSCVESYCGKPGWKLGLHAGFPLGSAPEDQTLNLGLLLGTPLGVNIGPLNIGLGAGAFTYDFEKIYIGGGLLASLCVNDLLKLDIPVRFQLHGIGFYIFGEDQGLGFGGIGSASVPFGKSPVSLGLYGGLGKYYPNDNEYNWGNAGAVLFYSL